MSHEATIAALTAPARAQDHLALAIHDASVIAQRIAPEVNTALTREGANRATALLSLVVMLAGTISTREDAEEVMQETNLILTACVRTARKQPVPF
jgi:hypothetical protein